MFRLSEEQREQLAARVYSVEDLERELGRLYQAETDGNAFFAQSTCRLMVLDADGATIGLGILVAFAQGLVLFEPYEEYGPYYGLVEAEDSYFCLRTFEAGVDNTALTLLPDKHSAVIEEAPTPGLAGLTNPTQYFLVGEEWRAVENFLQAWLPAPIPEQAPA
ncbi:hypothetical protein HY374_01080 [Candidatus Berkelbacteria bacterium]|nr:hypothetical protein [Candidatus Berkelbacteria bacterium]